ncbi:MAG: ABC transporter ATP-binding protein [Acidobacteria bacterium]|nr:MAG: ABC transporter ATP-binding protein [Acidobacteriota bacterium]
MTDLAVRFSHVQRRYGRVVALDDVDLEVPRGVVLGLVGRNGSGKTTTLRLISGLLHPDRGKIEVLGFDPVSSGLEVRRRVSYMPEESALYPWMTVDELLRFAGRTHPRWDADLAARLARRLDLPGGARVGTLSRGMRAKAALVAAAACRCELLLLDDPASGLDPLVRREILEAILEAIPAEGGTVVFASHLIQDIERVADHVVLLDGGRVRLQESVERLKAHFRRATAVFADEAPSDPAPLTDLLEWRAEGRTLSLIARSRNGELRSRLRALGATHVDIEPLALEDIVIATLRGRSSSGDRL